MLSIRQNEYAAFYTTHEFFDDHTAGGIAKHATQHLLEFFLGFFKGGENQYTLACTKSISFENVRRLQCLKEGQTF